MSKYQGQRTATINSLCDDIIYCNYDKSKYNTVLFPVMAGVTNADPEYFIKRSLADVKYAVMSFPVAADKSGSVNAKYNVQILQRDVVDEHIIAALEEA